MAEDGDNNREISSGEEKARADGWTPKEEWVESGGDEASWVDHKEFNFRGELMNRISSQTRNLKSRDRDIEELRGAIRELTTHNRKVAEAEYKKALRDLKHQKLQAAKEENPEAVIEIENQIDELKEHAEEFKNTASSTENVNQNQEEPRPEFVAWVKDEKNSWYMKDNVMQYAANGIVAEYIRNNPEGTPTEALEFMEKQIKEEFPHKFNNKRKLPRSSSVTEQDPNGGGPGGDGGGKKKYNKSDLSEEQLVFAKTFEMQGALSIQEYVNQLAELGELPSQQRG